MIAPKIIDKNHEDLFKESKRLAGFYLPDWEASDNDVGVGLLKIFAHMSEEIASRMNRVPEKNLGAFLDMLGLRLMPAQPARAPVTFCVAEGVQGSTFVPAGTQVATEQAEDRAAQVYETERGVSASKATLIEVFSVDPCEDTIRRHSEDFLSGRTFEIFPAKEKDQTQKDQDQQGNLQEHALFIGHNEIFTVSEASCLSIEIIFDKEPSSSIRDKLSWYYWSGEKGWIEKKFDPIDTKRANTKVFELSVDGDIKNKEINKINSYWIKLGLKSIKGEDKGSLPCIKDINISAKTKESKGLIPDLGFYNFTPLDLIRYLRLPEGHQRTSVLPFGEQPKLFDTFYIACKEAFSKKGNEIKLTFENKPSASDPPASDINFKPCLSWEYWKGTTWVPLGISENGTKFEPKTFLGEIKFICPEDLEEVEVNGVRSLWIRVRLVSGGYGRDEFKQESDVWIVSPRYNPPMISSISIRYSPKSETNGEEAQLKGKRVQYCLAHNNFQWEDLMEKAANMDGFCPFRPLSVDKPALYLGFKEPFGKGNASIFFSMEEGVQSPPVNLSWSHSYASPTSKSDLEAFDSTNCMTKSGTLEFMIASESLVVSSNFGRDCFWLTGVLDLFELDGRARPRIRGIYPNTVWAEQVETIADEILGSSDGEKGQVYRTIRRPVSSQEVWVREGIVISEGDRRDLLQNEGLKVEDVKDRLGRVVDSWVRWKKVDSFLFSDPRSRHYVMDNALGEITFGDGEKGRIPPTLKNNIKISYKSGGGLKGNAAAWEIKVLKTPIAGIDRVYNHEAAEGGSDTEDLKRLFERGPQLLRHRDRAVTKEDFERLAKASSSYIARAKCIVKDDKVKVIIIPNGEEDAPNPSPGLLKSVREYLISRCLSTLSQESIEVKQPCYIEVKISADVVPEPKVEPVSLERDITTKLKEFLHPLKGGSEGNGWEFGRGVHISDIYAIIEGIKGVDHVKMLSLNAKKEDIDLSREGNEALAREEKIIRSGEHRIHIDLGAKV